MEQIKQETIRILICEDEPLFGDGLELQLSRIDEFAVMACLQNEGELFDYLTIRQGHIDVLLLDMKIYEVMDAGIGILAKLRKQNALDEFKVLVLSARTTDPLLIRKSISLGASGYLAKDIKMTELVDKIFRASRGEKHLLSSTIGSTLLKTPAGVDLTKREIEVLKLVAKGYSVTEIAETLFISDRTVDTHKQNIREKLGLRKDIDFLIWVFRQRPDWLDDLLA